eukprot:7264857-Pyramimonas_sp.AAC.1
MIGVMSIQSTVSCITQTGFDRGYNVERLRRSNTESFKGFFDLKGGPFAQDALPGQNTPCSNALARGRQRL